MKKSSVFKKIKEGNESIISTLEDLPKQIKKIHSHYEKELLKYTNDLISRIALGENLDEIELKDKYVKKKKKKAKENIKEENEEMDQEIVLDQVTLEGEVYYYENKENGLIYNSNSETVGKYKNGQFIF